MTGFKFNKWLNVFAFSCILLLVACTSIKTEQEIVLEYRAKIDSTLKLVTQIKRDTIYIEVPKKHIFIDNCIFPNHESFEMLQQILADTTIKVARMYGNRIDVTR